MSNKVYPYFYDRQFESYISQFTRIFKGFQYNTGNNEANGDPILATVPVYYGAMDRIVASILTKREPNFSHRKLPVIAVNLSSIADDLNARRVKAHKDELVYNDGTQKGTLRKVGKGLILSLEINILASSQIELFSIVEQILLVFNPRVTIQFSSDALDVDNKTEVSLQSVQSEISYPLGTEKSTVSIGMEFEMPVRLEYPRKDAADFINQIEKTIYTGDYEEANMEAMSEVIEDEDNV